MQPKVIISGGGTGGHIFPALAIANKIKSAHPNAKILFVGAIGKMEMTKIPEHGYEIIGLNIAGIQRKLTVKNLFVPSKLIGSLLKARKIIKEINPDIVIGVGGYASGPLLKATSWNKTPYILQEQNSYPGITNKLLAKKASKICVAYPNMNRFFESSKIVFTGNPIRANILSKTNKKEAIKHFKLDESKKTILIIGGSLGARTINNSIEKFLENNTNNNVQLIWQTGSYYFNDLKQKHESNPNVHITAFIKEMNLAYSAADLVISRSGALSVSELCAVNKAVIFIPSPNVSEDHQTKNAMALVNKDAALLISDKDAPEKLSDVIKNTINNTDLLNKLETNISQLAKLDATDKIYEQVKNVAKW